MPAGRPPIFESDEELQAAVDLYFSKCDADEEQPTITGLSFALGMTRETLRAYGERDEFSDTVKRAKQRVEIALEQRLYASAPTGAIFNLKNNFGWKDQQEQTHGVSPELLALIERLNTLDDDQLDAIEAGL